MYLIKNIGCLIGAKMPIQGKYAGMIDCFGSVDVQDQGNIVNVYQNGEPLVCSLVFSLPFEKHFLRNHL